jgi:PKD repeat protein
MFLGSRNSERSGIVAPVVDDLELSALLRSETSNFAIDDDVELGGAPAAGRATEGPAPISVAMAEGGFEAPAGTVTVTPSTGVFGFVPVGTASPVMTFTAQNNTAATAAYAGSTGLDQFNLQPGTCHLVNGDPMLAPGASCQFTVSFKPTSVGPVSGSINITTSSGPVSVPISGTGAGVILTPSGDAFGNVTIGATSPVVTFTITNYTGATGRYVNATGLAEFNLQPGTCHLVNGDPMLNSGASCTFTAAFAPTAPGAVSGTINLLGGLGPVAVPLSGTGVPGLSVNPAAASFGSVPVGTKSPTLTFTVHNSTASTASYVSQTGTAEFNIQPGSCNLVSGIPMLAAGASCAFTAAFTPTAPGPANGGITLKSSAGTLVFPLSGTGSQALLSAQAGGPYKGVTGKPVAFSGSGSTAPSGQTLTTYAWNFGDGTSGTGVSPTHSYANVGTYNVSLTVTDTGGQTSLSKTTAQISQAPNPLSIKATVSPAPNAAGWNNSPATVTFTCSSTGPPVATCTAPQTVTSDGAGQAVTGTATDTGGDTATASVTVNLETTPPVLSVTSPANNATITLSTTTIGISGSVSSKVASIVSVTCGGVPAVVSGAAFTCTAVLKAGANSIPVIATDIAGNKTTLPLALTYAQAPAINIISPANLGITNLTPVTVSGTVNDPSATVTIDGVAVPQSGGGFSTAVPLVEGLNILTAVATNTSGISTTATLEVTLDTTPPHVTINSPPNGSVLTASSVTVSGLANDVVVGTVNLQDLKVTVNGVAAQVANRSFSAMNVPLALGANTIQATGTDRAGNGTTTSVSVTRVLPSQPPAPAVGKAVLTQWVNIVSGNNQTGVVGAALSAPIVVSLTDSASNPVPNQAVVFKVTANNGVVSSAGGTPSSAVAVTTDANGHAQVTWTLGQRAGAGNNVLQVSSALAVTPQVFTATGSTGPSAQIVVDSGNNQTGVLGQPLPFPFVVDVVDAGHNRVPGVPIVFTVKQGGGNFAGSPTATVTSDSNGRVLAILTAGLQEGINNEVVEANFAGNPGMPAAFVATAKAPGNPSGTTISGVVLDNSNNPIQNVTIRLYKTNQGSGNNLPVQVGTPVETDAQGTFVIAPAPVGSFKLMADGSTASGTTAFPTLEYDIVTVAGNDNTVGMPIYLPALDTVDKVCVDETHGGILTLPQYPGFALNIAAGSATFPGGARSGCVSATPVNGDKVPMAPGFGQQPRFIVTIQPVGTMFNPPAAMTLPNVDGLKPKAVTEMYSYDHDLAMFVAIGTGTVSSDGSVIQSDPGVGVVKAGWHCGGDPNTIGSAGTCPLCQTCTGDSCAADPSQDGTPDPENKCMVCMGGALAQVPDGAPVTTTYTFDGLSKYIEQLNNILVDLDLSSEVKIPEFGGKLEEVITPHCCEDDPNGQKKEVTGSLTVTLGEVDLKPQFPPYTGNYGPFKVFGQSFSLSYGIEVSLEASASAGLKAETECDEPTKWSGTLEGEVEAGLNLFGQVDNPALPDECGPKMDEACSLINIKGGATTSITVSAEVTSTEIDIGKVEWSGIDLGISIQLLEGTFLDFTYSSSIQVLDGGTLIEPFTIPLPTL